MTSEKRKSRIALKIILPLLIILLGIGTVKFISKLKKEPQRQNKTQQGVLVNTQPLELVNHKVIVTATGIVEADQEISLSTQVSGKVSWVSEKLVSGGLVKQGESLFKIEEEDYQLAIEQARSEVAQAEVALAKEEEQARIAREEWERMKLPNKGEPGPLVTHEIQLRQQQAILTAAKANLRKAQLNFRRTEVKAPFNGRIRNESIDLGQYVVAGSSVATLAGTDRAEIHVPLALSELSWLDLQNSKTKAAASIYQPERPDVQWQGEVIRSLGEIDSTSRTATVIVGVKDPYRRTGAPGPILPQGQFVELKLHGKTLQNVISIPRKALRGEGSIWLVDDNNLLQIKDINIIRRELEQILISNQDLNGRKLILTNISGAAEGTLLRLMSRESQQ